MPDATRLNLVRPAACRITDRPLADVRRIGPGVGDQASPVSSSRMNSASPLGSMTGSFANGVRRFWRLFDAHVKAAPDADTIVPNVGFAITFGVLSIRPTGISLRHVSCETGETWLP